MSTILPFISIVGPPGTDKELIARILGGLGVLGVRLNDRLVFDLQNRIQNGRTDSDSDGKWTKVEMDYFLNLVACTGRVHAMACDRKQKQFSVIDFPVNGKYGKELDHNCRYPRKLVLLQCPKQKCLDNFLNASNACSIPTKEVLEEFERQWDSFEANKTSLLQYHCRVWGLPLIIDADKDVKSIRHIIRNSYLLKPSVVPQKMVEKRRRRLSEVSKAAEKAKLARSDLQSASPYIA